MAELKKYLEIKSKKGDGNVLYIPVEKVSSIRFFKKDEETASEYIFGKSTITTKYNIYVRFDDGRGEEYSFINEEEWNKARETFIANYTAIGINDLVLG